MPSLLRNCCDSTLIDIVLYHANAEYELGMFLWVKLIIDTLSQATVLQDFEEAVENLPEGLDEV